MLTRCSISLLDTIQGVAINPWRDVPYEGICHTKLNLYKHPLENLYTEQCSLKGSCTNRLNCHQVLICVCTDTFRRKFGVQLLTWKVRFPKWMPVPLLKSVSTGKSQKLNKDSDYYFTAPLLRICSYCHLSNNTKKYLLSDAMLPMGEILSPKKYILHQQANTHQSQVLQLSTDINMF